MDVVGLHLLGLALAKGVKIGTYHLVIKTPVSSVYSLCYVVKYIKQTLVYYSCIQIVAMSNGNGKYMLQNCHLGEPTDI